MIFLLTTVLAETPSFEAALSQHFPNEFIRVHPNTWLISASTGLTSKDVWDRLVGTRTPMGLIVSVGGYYGRENSTVWEWIALKRTTALQ